VNPLLLVLLVAVPFIGILVLVVLLNRWGSRRDPMGGSAKDLWSTTGTQPKSNQHQD
jgi:hypothetical protein